MVDSDALCRFSYRTSSAEDTVELGRRLAAHLPPGSVVALMGPLGGGKTTFVKGLAQGLEVAGNVRSPTYSLLHEYEGDVPLYHFDAYRLDDPDEFLLLGAEEKMYGRGVSVIEWADKVAEHLPERRLQVKFDIAESAGERTVEIKAFGRRYCDILKNFKKWLAG